MRFLGNGRGVPRDALHEAAGNSKLPRHEFGGFMEARRRVKRWPGEVFKIIVSWNLSVLQKPQDAHFEPFEVCQNLLNCAAEDDT
ncbi:hypothetical protein CEXT_366791 [Caerostris extrusa]|uniref:Uncharacterized protein n=1 Tax=Caerostris extrusa TaxID=172846 RepID=A0AAV4W4X5_CAEEX|nr:hypothetical protein CEXT_366791 [Caerostris extrusa]